jgi:DNA repair protein RadC
MNNSIRGLIMKRIYTFSHHQKPREKLIEKGARALSDNELLAIIIGSGIRGHDCMEIAGRIMEALDNEAECPDPVALRKIKGVGWARSLAVTAALEFARRRIRPEGVKITFPTDALPLVRHYADRRQEHFLSLSLNGAHEIIAIRVVTVGLVDKTHVHPREVFADAITDRASAIIVAHNHPSGCMTPSREDREVTAQLRDAGDLLGIKLLDHIIFNHRGYHSFLEEGTL